MKKIIGLLYLLSIISIKAMNEQNIQQESKLEKAEAACDHESKLEKAQAQLERLSTSEAASLDPDDNPERLIYVGYKDENNKLVTAAFPRKIINYCRLFKIQIEDAKLQGSLVEPLLILQE